MNQKQKTKLKLLVFISSIVLMIVGLISYALRQNISLYYTPEQIETQLAPIGQLIRVGGMVVKGSIIQEPKRLNVEFALTDYHSKILVHYQGVLPDLFREGQGVVVKGRLVSANDFQALEVLAKHDENYMPKEVRDSLKTNGVNQ